MGMKLAREAPIAGVLLVAVLLLGAAPRTSAVRGGTVGQRHTAAGLKLIAFRFGREGGNAPPFTATIRNDGMLLVKGGGPRVEYYLAIDAVAGLLKLAEAEGFFALRQNIVCSVSARIPQGEVPTSFITINTNRGSRSVTSFGGCTRNYDQLYDVLTAVARV